MHQVKFFILAFEAHPFILLTQFRRAMDGTELDRLAAWLSVGHLPDLRSLTALV